MTIASALNASGFTVRGQTVHPGCVALFNSNMTSPPFVKAVDLQRCQTSMLKRSRMRVNAKDLVKANNYTYQVVGKTGAGIYVLHTWVETQASRQWDMVLFLKMENSILYAYSGAKAPYALNQQLAVLLGYVSGGDRCSGGIKQVVVKGDSVEIQQYPARNSQHQCRGEKTYVINTTDWQQ